jgi:IS30 family transposase
LQKHDTFWYGVKCKKVMRYSAQIAQQKYEINCTSHGRPIKIGKNYDFVHYIEKRVTQDKLSACAVLGEIKRKHLFNFSISKPTLYRYIKMGLFENIYIAERKQKYKKVVAKRAPKGTSIEKRPAEIRERRTFGHWEMDCVCGSNKATFLVLSERLTRKEIIFKMENQKADSVIKCLNVLERKFGKMFRRVFKTITVDNGSEFSDFHGIEKSSYGKTKRTSVYYCHPYCSSERGTNERLNREIRRLVPKGSALSKYTIEDVQKIEDWVNAYPREVLGYATSAELFEQQMQLLK